MPGYIAIYPKWCNYNVISYNNRHHVMLFFKALPINQLHVLIGTIGSKHLLWVCYMHMQCNLLHVYNRHKNMACYITPI